MIKLNPKRLYALIGQRVKREREALGFAQDDLSFEVNLSRTSITNIEAGRQYVTLHSLYKIALAMGVPIGVLLPDESEVTDHEPAI